MPDSQLSIETTRFSSKRGGALSNTYVGEKCQILAKKGFLTARNLKSDIVLLMYSDEYQLGVLIHLSAFDHPEETHIQLDADPFVNPALTIILTEFESLGVARENLLTYAVGGSFGHGTSSMSEYTLRQALHIQGLSLSACDIGGLQSRSIWMDVRTGRTIVRSEAIADNERESTATHPVAS